MSTILSSQCHFNDDGDYLVAFSGSSYSSSFHYDLSIRTSDCPYYNPGEFSGVEYLVLSGVGYFNIGYMPYSSQIKISIKLDAESYWSSAVTLTIPDDPSYPSTKLLTYVPLILDQYLKEPYNNAGVYNIQAGTCLPCSLVTMKDIFSFHRGTENYHKYSIGWIYGNRSIEPENPTDFNVGMNVNDALDHLISDGVPKHTLIPENEAIFSGPYYYPDNYLYIDDGEWRTVGAKQLVQNNYSNTTILKNANLHKISSYNRYLYWWDVSSIKQKIIDNGCVLILTETQNPVNYSMSTGIFSYLPTGSTYASHSLVAVGWKKIGNINYWICINSWGNTGDSNSGIYYFPMFANYDFDIYFIEDAIPSIEEFSWTNPKVSGGQFNLLATEWNGLVNKINSVYSYYGWSTSSYPMRQVQSGWNFEAVNDFNKVRLAIGSKRATGITDKIAGDQINASYLNTLVEKINDLI